MAEERQNHPEAEESPTEQEQSCLRNGEQAESAPPSGEAQPAPEARTSGEASGQWRIWIALGGVLIAITGGIWLQQRTRARAEAGSLVNMARNAVDNLRYDQAEELLERAVSLVDDDPDLLFNYAQLLIRNGKYERAWGVLDKVAAQQPEKWENWVELVRADALTGRKDLAAEHLHKAAETGFCDHRRISENPDYNPLREHKPYLDEYLNMMRRCGKLGGPAPGGVDPMDIRAPLKATLDGPPVTAAAWTTPQNAGRDPPPEFPKMPPQPSPQQPANK
ncbi:MAG: Beta-barrel assembly-enhancing protease [Myxococcota bacterium]|nr:Beta-barrel assembly-enhancing protease [Myxococcota bacterium]